LGVTDLAVVIFHLELDHAVEGLYQKLNFFRSLDDREVRSDGIETLWKISR